MLKLLEELLKNRLIKHFIYHIDREGLDLSSGKSQLIFRKDGVEIEMHIIPTSGEMLIHSFTIIRKGGDVEIF